MDEEENVEEIEKENEKNINDTINFMSMHINGKMTKEYLDFIKKTRKFKKKIDKKKAKLAENGMLEQAYQKKEGKVDEYFKEMSKDYKGTMQSRGNFRGVMYRIPMYSGTYTTDVTNIEMDCMMNLINLATGKRKYVEQTLYEEEECLPIEERETRSKITGVEIKARDEIIQKHFDSITAYIMGQVLCYYDSELNFWKEEYKKVEKLEDVRNFE